MTMSAKRAALLGGVGLSMVLLFARAAYAEPWDDCRARIEDARAHLDRAVHRHGPDSEQARKWHRALEEDRDWCWTHHHGWWDAEAHIWRTTHW